MSNLYYYLLLYHLPKFFERSGLRSNMRIQEESRKSAVAAVMSRNMSHNIGSHVLARLSSVSDYLKEPDQKGAEPRSLILQTACLNSYLRTRMDFLADVSTAVPFITTPKYFYSDAICYFRPISGDELNDKDEHRWPKLLVDNISGGVKVGVDGSPLDSSRIQLHVKVASNGNLIKRGSHDDPVVAFPNDALGLHALYVILENIIRNCAKHSKIESGLVLTLTANNAVRGNKHLCLLEIVDNLGSSNPSRKQTDANGTNILLNRLEQYCNASILDSASGQLRQGGWGVLEMKIAAAYLRRIGPAEVDAQVKTDEVDGKKERFIELSRNSRTVTEPPILSPFLDRQGNLGYKLYLEKPKIALIASEKGDELISAEMKGDLETIGIEEVTYGAVDLSKGTEHEFLVCVNPTQDQISKAYHSNQRFLVTDESNLALQNVLKTRDVITIRHMLWDQKVSGMLSRATMCRATNCDNVDTWFKNSYADGSFTIFFDNHGSCYKGEPPSSRGCSQYDFDSMFYYEPYPTNGPTGLILERIQKLAEWENSDTRYKHEKQTLLAELVDSSWLQCAIIDERIQEGAEKVDLHLAGKQKKQIWVLERMRVDIPSKHKVDLSKQEYEDADKETIESWVQQAIRQIEVGFAVIHLGIIEKIVGTNKDRIAGWLKRFEDQTKGQDKSLVVISGRGRPSNLPEDTLFLPYSLIARYVFEYRSKYHLCKVLRSARRNQ
jgi:hypothetical protein